jgi:hypothetical protein
MDSPGSGLGPVVGSCEHGDEPLGSGIMELVSSLSFLPQEFSKNMDNIKK